MPSGRYIVEKNIFGGEKTNFKIFEVEFEIQRTGKLEPRPAVKKSTTKTFEKPSFHKQRNLAISILTLSINSRAYFTWNETGKKKRFKIHRLK